jgi:hypothetical protein
MSRLSSGGRTPEIPDPYLGTVYGNILDIYDNPSYNLRLYMRPVGQSSSSLDSIVNSPDMEAARARETNTTTTTPKDNTGNQSGRRDIKEVTIAQTGVTGNIIDDLEIDTRIESAGGFLTTGAKFRIFQPGGANLLDQIATADMYLGNEVTTTPIMYLDIRFQGYNHDPDDNDGGGQTATILGPITFKCKLLSINTRIDNTGSNYDFEVTLENTSAFADTTYRVLKDTTTQGKTITQHVKMFEAELNKMHKNFADANYERPDQFVIDLSGLIGDGSSSVGFEGGNSTKIKDDTLATSNDRDAQDSNRGWTNLINDTIDDEEGNTQDPPSNKGRTDIVVEGDTLKVKSGTSIDRYIFNLLSMNKEFLSMITRKTNFSDPSNLTVEKAKTFIKWMRMNAEVQELQWDNKRKAYTRKYTYKPTLYDTGRSDIAITSDEVNITATEAAATQKLNEMYSAGSIHKSYYYLFTGRNDQILNLDINFSGSQVLLVPPKGGVIGDVSLTAAVALNSTVAQNADASGKELFSKAKNAANKAKFGDLLKSIKDTTDSLNAVAGAVGRTPDQLRTILADTTGRAQQVLADSIDTRTRNAVVSGAAMSKDSPTVTAPPNGTTPGGGTYKPDLSGFTYSEDLVMSSNAVDVKDLKNFDIANAEFRYEVLSTSTVPNIAEGATYVTTNPGNTLFGYVYQQHNSSAFLNKVNLTVRGDPWYLGKAAGQIKMAEKSTPTSISYTANDNYFILQIATPQPYDPDVEDEDSSRNSGFWNFNGISNSFSGLYMISKVVNHFRNGVYTVDIEASKNMAVPLHKVRRVRRDETPRDLTTVAGYDEAMKTIGAPASAIGDPTNPDPPTGDPLAPLVGTPPPVGQDKESMAQLRNWLIQNGTRADENPLFPGDYNADAHSSNEHREGRAFDVNIQGAGYEWNNPAYKAKFDQMQTALQAQGWNVVWGSKGHYNHLHVYAKRGTPGTPGR